MLCPQALPTFDSSRPKSRRISKHDQFRKVPLRKQVKLPRIANHPFFFLWRLHAVSSMMGRLHRSNKRPFESKRCLLEGLIFTWPVAEFAREPSD